QDRGGDDAGSLASGGVVPRPHSLAKQSCKFNGGSRRIKPRIEGAAFCSRKTARSFAPTAGRVKSFHEDLCRDLCPGRTHARLASWRSNAKARRSRPIGLGGSWASVSN